MDKSGEKRFRDRQSVDIDIREPFGAVFERRRRRRRKGIKNKG
jgi:hypothetical protein